MARVQNAMELIERTKINPHYVLCFNNAVDICNSSQNVFDRIDNAFTFGYAQGMKAARAAQRKAAKA